MKELQGKLRTSLQPTRKTTQGSIIFHIFRIKLKYTLKSFMNVGRSRHKALEGIEQNVIEFCETYFPFIPSLLAYLLTCLVYDKSEG